MKRGRKPYSFEFAEKVRELYFHTSCSAAMVARHFNISELTADKMISRKDSYKKIKEERTVIELTEEQLRHLESIKWLIGGPLACGKSTVLAIAFIQYAEKNPGRRIEVFDHELHTYRMNKRFMLDRIKNLVKGREGFTFYLIDNSFIYSKSKDAK